jgi:hypothetical protein
MNGMLILDYLCGLDIGAQGPPWPFQIEFIKRAEIRVSVAFAALTFIAALWLPSFGGIYGAQDLGTATMP